MVYGGDILLHKHVNLNVTQKSEVVQLHKHGTKQIGYDVPCIIIIYVMMICMVSIQDAEYNAVGAVTDKKTSLPSF